QAADAAQRRRRAARSAARSDAGHRSQSKVVSSAGSRLTDRSAVAHADLEPSARFDTERNLFPTDTHPGAASGRWMCTPASREARCGHILWLPPTKVGQGILSDRPMWGFDLSSAGAEVIQA